MLPGFESVYVCVIAFNGHAKPCIDCDKLEKMYLTLRECSSSWTDGCMTKVFAHGKEFS